MNAVRGKYVNRPGLGAIPQLFVSMVVVMIMIAMPAVRVANHIV
jgi:hypothetical protein